MSKLQGSCMEIHINIANIDQGWQYFYGRVGVFMNLWGFRINPLCKIQVLHKANDYYVPGQVCQYPYNNIWYRIKLKIYKYVQKNSTLNFFNRKSFIRLYVNCHPCPW